MDQLINLIQNHPYLSQTLPDLKTVEKNIRLYQHLQRFLIAKQNDSTAAFKKLLRYHKWYDQLVIPSFDSIVEQIDTGKVMLIPHKDANEKLVLIIKASKHQAKKDQHDQVMDLVTRCCFYIVKHAMNNVIMIVDLDSFGFSNLDMGLPKKIGKFTTMYFPSYIDQLLFINASFLAMTTWKLIKPLVPDKHLRRIDFIDHTTQLKNQQGVNLEQMPLLYGGQWNVSEEEWLEFTKKEFQEVDKIRY